MTDANKRMNPLHFGSSLTDIWMWINAGIIHTKFLKHNQKCKIQVSTTAKYNTTERKIMHILVGKLADGWYSMDKFNTAPELYNED